MLPLLPCCQKHVDEVAGGGRQDCAPASDNADRSGDDWVDDRPGDEKRMLFLRRCRPRKHGNAKSCFGQPQRPIQMGDFIEPVEPEVYAGKRRVESRAVAAGTIEQDECGSSWILSALRTSVGFAVVGATFGEYLGASAGLGYLIARSEGNFDAVGVFTGIIILAVFVLIIDLILDVVEKKLITRRPNAGEERPRLGRAKRFSLFQE